MRLDDEEHILDEEDHVLLMKEFKEEVYGLHFIFSAFVEICLLQDYLNLCL